MSTMKSHSIYNRMVIEMFNNLLEFYGFDIIMNCTKVE